MSEVLMFNPNTLEQYFANPHKKEEINKMKERGWIENPRLVHMYHPHSRDNKMVMVQERKIWESKGYYAEPTFLYHPTETNGTQLFPADEVSKMLTKGWYRSPAHFPGNSEGKLKTLVMKEAG